MAKVTKVGVGEFEVVGDLYTLRVLLSLDDVNGALWHVWNEIGADVVIAIKADVNDALEWAEEYADLGGDDPEIGDCMSDAEADADVLASAGWGTDEDYGDFGCYECE